MTNSIDGKIDYKESFFRLIEENEVIGKAALEYVNRIDRLKKEVTRLRNELADPGMENDEYRYFLDLLMCSDPWPVESVDGINEDTIKQFANRKAEYLGFKSFIDAYHNFEV